MKKPTHYIVTFEVKLPIDLVEADGDSAETILKEFTKVKEDMMQNSPKGSSITLSIKKE